MPTDEIARRASITTDMFNYSFKLSAERKLRLFADSGLRHIHWCDDWNDEVLYTNDEVRRRCQLVESHGMKCLDVHGADTEIVHIAAPDDSVLDRYVQLLENRLEFCSAMGGDAVVIHPPSERTGPGEISWKIDRSFRVLDRVRPLCEDLGVVLAVENCYPNDGEILREYFERYPPEFIAFCLDSGHANLNKDMDALSEFASRLRALHLHDNKGNEDDHQPPFWGTVDWKRVIQWIERSGYAKPLNFEITHHPELFEGSPDGFLELCVRSIRKVIALVGR